MKLQGKWPRYPLAVWEGAVRTDVSWPDKWKPSFPLRGGTSAGEEPWTYHVQPHYKTTKLEKTIDRSTWTVKKEQTADWHSIRSISIKLLSRRPVYQSARVSRVRYAALGLTDQVGTLNLKVDLVTCGHTSWTCLLHGTRTSAKEAVKSIVSLERSSPSEVLEEETATTSSVLKFFISTPDISLCTWTSSNQTSTSLKRPLPVNVQTVARATKSKRDLWELPRKATDKKSSGTVRIEQDGGSEWWDYSTG